MKPTIKKIYTALMMGMLYVFLLCFFSKFFGVIPRPLDNHFEFLIAATGFNSVALGVGYLLHLIYSRWMNAPVKTDKADYFNVLIAFIRHKDKKVWTQPGMPTNEDDLRWILNSGIPVWASEMRVLKYLSAYFEIMECAQAAALALDEQLTDNPKIQAA
jgi:hypothetical protein